MRKIINKVIFIFYIIIIIEGTISVGLAETNVTVSPTATITSTVTSTPAITTTASVTTVAATTIVTPTASTVTEGKFRVGPSVTLRPVIDVIETDQDGIVEFFMNNPSLNDVTLNVDYRMSVPSGIHVYGQSYGEGAGAGVVAGTFSVPPGTSRTIVMVVKADKSARIGSHTISFTGLYWPGENKDNYQPLSLSYSVTVKEPSKKPESSEPSNPEAVPKGAEMQKPSIPGFGAIMAIFGVFAIASLMSRKKRYRILKSF